MKRVYFVRHGQTPSNTNNIVQPLDESLTPEGELQAIRVAERLTTLPITRCISSDLNRTRQTAEHIYDRLRIPFTYTDLFREIARPSSLIGYSRTSDEYRAFIEADRLRAHEDWHQEDEENFHDRVKRAQAALAYLEAEESEDILVVTHGHFLRFLVCTILTKGQLTPELWQVMNRGFWTSNTNLSVCTHNEYGWRLMTWNDHAHFGDTVFRPHDH